MRERATQAAQGRRRRARAADQHLPLAGPALPADRARARRAAARLLDLRFRRLAGASSRTCCRPGTKADALERMRQTGVEGQERGPVPEQALEAASSPREIEAAEVYAQLPAPPRRLQRGRFRRPDPPAAGAARRRRRAGRGLARTHPLPAGRRVPGHQRRAVPPAEGPGRPARRLHRGRRRRPEHLCLARRQSGEPATNWRSDYPALKVVKLEQNYRCSARILRAANAVIAQEPARAPRKKLWSAARRRRADPRAANARTTSTRPRRSPSEIRYRQAQARRALERVRDPVPRQPPVAARWKRRCSLLRMPYHLTGGTAFLERAEVKDAARLAAPARQPRRRRGLPARGGVAQARGRRAPRWRNWARLAQPRAPGPAVARGREVTPCCSSCRRARPSALAGFTTHRSASCAPRRESRGAGELVAPLMPSNPALLARTCARSQGRGAACSSAAWATSTNWSTGCAKAPSAAGRRRRPRRATGAADPRRPRRSRQRRAADDPARRQGPRVPLRVHRSAARTATCRTRAASRKAASTRSAACSTSASPAPRNSSR